MRRIRLLAAVVASALVASLAAPPLAGAVTVPETPPAAATAAAGTVLIVRAYSTSPSDVLLGERFRLTLSLVNATKRRAKDVVVSLGSTSAAASGGSGETAATSLVVPLGTSDVKFVGDIKGRDSADVSFDLISNPKGTPGVYALPVNVSYDLGGTREQMTQSIGIIVNRTASFAEQTANVSESAVVGEPMTVTLDIANTSSFAVPGVVVRLEGPGFQLANATVQAGKVEAGDVATLEAQATPERSGDATLTVVISYRDDFNAVREVRFPHRVSVEPAPKDGSGEGTKTPEGDKAPKGPLDAIASFFLGLLGLGG